MRQQHLELSVRGVSCEAPVIERMLREIPGVLDIYVNPVTNIAYVECDLDLVTSDQLAKAIRELGYSS